MKKKALRYPWTKKSFDMMLMWRNLGYEWEEIARELQNRFNHPCNSKIVQNRYYNKNKFSLKQQRKVPNFEIVELFASIQVATIYHLLDLKRAGHSPKQTELKIPGGRPIRMDLEFYSYLTSPSVLCAENVGL